MRSIRWNEVPEARQLAGLGKRLSRAAQTRLQWMLFYFFNGRNGVRTCRHFGISRQTFYRWKRRFDRHDLATLEERSHPRNSSKLASRSSCPYLCSRPNHPNSMPTWSVRIARTTKSSIRCTPTPIRCPSSIANCVSGNTPTTMFGLTSPWPTSLHRNLSHVGNLNSERQSVTNLLDEYTVLAPDV